MENSYTELEPKIVLLTTDLSVEAAKAYPYAKMLAQKFNARLIAVTLIDTSIQFGISGPFDMPIVYLPETVTQMREQASKTLNEHCEKHFADIKVQSVVQEYPGPVHYGLTEYIVDHNVDLVVMASHGRSGVARTLLGSVAEQVVRRSPKPVFVVPVKDEE